MKKPSSYLLPIAYSGVGLLFWYYSFEYSSPLVSGVEAKLTWFLGVLVPWLFIHPSLKKIAGLCALIACASPHFSPPLSTLLIIPWIIVVLFSIRYSIQNISNTPEHFTSWIYVLNGLVFLVAFRNSWNVFNFSPALILLTPTHFYFIGLLILGTSAHFKDLLSPLLRYSLIASPAWVALGITFSNTLEITGTLWFIISVLFLFGSIAKRTQHKPTRLFAWMTFCCFSMSLLLACTWSLGQYFHFYWITFLTMVNTHGMINAYLISPLILILIHLNHENFIQKTK